MTEFFCFSLTASCWLEDILKGNFTTEDVRCAQWITYILQQGLQLLHMNDIKWDGRYFSVCENDTEGGSPGTGRTLKRVWVLCFCGLKPPRAPAGFCLLLQLLYGQIMTSPLFPLDSHPSIIHPPSSAVRGCSVRPHVSEQSACAKWRSFVLASWGQHIRDLVVKSAGTLGRKKKSSVNNHRQTLGWYFFLCNFWHVVKENLNLIWYNKIKLDDFLSVDYSDGGSCVFSILIKCAEKSTDIHTDSVSQVLYWPANEISSILDFLFT